MRLIQFFTLVAISIQSSHAYLDPGTGSILIQSLIAATAAAAIVIKTYWYRIKGFFSKSSVDDSTIVDDADNKDSSE